MSVRPSEPTRDDPVVRASAWCLRLSEGALMPAEQHNFDEWLEADEANRQAFDDAVRAWRAIDHASVSPELVIMRTVALNTFRRAQRTRWTPRMVVRASWSFAASVLVVALLLGATLWIGRFPKSYQTAAGERRVVVLADGSKISLDAATKVDIRYLSGRRELRLDRGRAKFTVAKNPNRPFTVAAADKVVLATGTEFSVELLRGQVHVILYQGHVAVLDKTPGTARLQHIALVSGGAPADQSLTPGRELVVPIAAEAAEVEVVDTARTLSWEGGQLVFVDEPLTSAVERINRYSDEKLQIGDAATGQTLISGVFIAGDTAAFVEGVTGVFPLQVRGRNGRKVLVHTAN